jgi:hypothetical protein
MASAGMKRILFVRVGWMRFYNGSIQGDERPVGGGRFNKTEIGHEVYNFRESGSHLYGYFQPMMASHALALERIDHEAADGTVLHNVLVVFVARRPEGGQVIVGWYGHAEVFRNQVERSPGKPQGYGHFCSAKRSNCVLLPDEYRRFEIPHGKNGMGQSNVCYPLNGDGSTKQFSWITRAIGFIGDYEGINLLDNPEADAENESAAAAERALAQSQGQGFARTREQRDAIERHAMDAAEHHFRSLGYHVDDVSARRSYDLLCRKGAAELHVEVKGTTTNGDAIVLTNKEVKHACDPNNACALFLLHSIHLKKNKAVGGKQILVEPWQPKGANLTPISFTYRFH